MGQALYRKYRSKSLDEVVGQEHITDTLGKALKTGRISHAYLFTGPRGVGKTSIARILAHEINGLAYDEGQTHLDIIEIDAASNRRIDEIRDLRDKVYIAPAQAKYKVYIIDEVHMLTREAFNALLKTLEEPPAHAVFILATTEAHKLPETIVSRTQRFVFRPIDPAKAVAHLRSIADQEKIAITEEALQFIAVHSGGSFRDSIGLLDQVGNSAGKIDLASVQDLLGIPPSEATAQLLAALETGAEASAIVQRLDQLSERGFQATAIAKQLSLLLREQILAGSATGSALPLLGKLLEVPTSHDPERYLEVVLLSLAGKATVTQHAIAPQPLPKSLERPVQEIVTTSKPEEPRIKPAEPKKKTIKTNETPTTQLVLDDASWAQILASLKSHHNTLYGIVRMAKPDFSEAGVLTLTFAFAFHQKRMNEAKNQQIVGAAIEQITGNKVEIYCLLDTNLKLADKQPANERPEVPKPKKQDDGSLATISNIFGGGELLQS